jgi:abhydrolase domain-containing protein 12
MAGGVNPLLVRTGAWHILPSEYHDKEGLRYKDDLDESVYDAALMNPDYDTMIYFHGNSLSRTAPIRIDFYKVHN